MPRRKCQTCGSKQWHKEPSSGLIACSEGHILQNYRNETTEIDIMGPHVMKKRAIKSGKVKKGKQSKADPKLYHGARGRYHYFLCLQLILRMQIATLTRLWDLPPEFEIVCKDLWTLYLTLLPDPLPEDAYQHAGGATEEGSDAKGKAKAKEDQDDSSEEDDQEKKTEDESSADEEEDPELEALMRENSDHSSSSDEYGESLPKVDSKKRGKRKGRAVYESPVATTAVLVVSCWMLRIPVMYRDFTKLIEQYELPYLDPMRFLPPSVVQHLTKHNIQALSPPHAPTTMSMHTLASRFAKNLYQKCGICVPEANGASLLWRVIKEMGCTPLVYVFAKRVASVLSMPLVLHWTLAPGLEKVKASDVDRHKLDSAPPEVQLVIAVVIGLKMVYRLEGKTREPDAGILACGLRKIDVDEKTKNVGDMKEEEMDEYIEFCERALLGQDKESVLEAFFSVERGTGMERAEGTGSEHKVWVGMDAAAERIGGEDISYLMEAAERRLAATSHDLVRLGI